MIQIKVVLADDHQIVRACLRAVLGAEPDIEVIGEAADGLQVADVVARLTPDALVLDLMMPGLNGLEVIRHVHRRSPDVRIIVLSMHADEGYILEALRNGAVGYVLKDASADNLITAVRTAAAGTRYLSPALNETVSIELSRQALEAAPDPYEKVTAREREVLQLAAEGHTNEAIAAMLFISRRTAEVHRTRVLEKLHLHNQTGLVKYAIRKGLVSTGS